MGVKVRVKSAKTPISTSVAILLAIVLAGCTRDVHTAQPQREQPVAPITALQVGDLLSPRQGRQSVHHR
jgi:PBP1b-binding outer membrane lipoprotein LpoB